MEVTYEVLSDAVEATVEVNLLVPGITHVYGHISASCDTQEDRRNVPLFERERGQKVELVPSSDNLMVPLELRRSVIAVPVHTNISLLQISMQLHAVTPNNNEDDVPLEGVVGFFFDNHKGEIYSIGDSCVPLGWTEDSDPKGGISASGGKPGASTSAGHEGTEQTSVQQCKAQVNVTSPGWPCDPRH